MPLKVPSGFFMTFVGARRSGKSTLIKKMLNSKDYLKDYFKEENIFIICPTLDLNDDYDNLSKARKFSTPDPQLLYDIMEEQKFNITSYGKKRTPEVLVIFDDCADNNILRFGGIIDTLAVRGRHFKINIMVSSQRMSAVSRTARLNSDFFIVFSPYNFSEIEQFIEQYVAKKDRKETIQKIQDVFEEPYAYIVVDNMERSPSKKLKIGFDKPLSSI